MPSTFPMTRRFALLGGLALATVGAALPAAAQQTQIAGSYRAEGRNPDGSSYGGSAVIGQQGNAVQINWMVGNQAYSGSGILDGQVLLINWGQADPVVYVVMPSGELHGTWQGGRALERLIPK